MAIKKNLGDTCTLTVDGHSAINGAPMPAGSSVVIVSNDATVATAADVPTLAADTPTFSTPVTLLSAGSTDFTVTVTDPSGNVFTAADSLIVNPKEVPGLTHVTATLS
jgi:hypothetical protein